MKMIGGGKGVFFTLAIVLILIPLILLVSYHSMSTKTKVVDTTEKIRCDELHYFVEDVKKDLARAGGIFGRRAAIYSIDYVIRSPGNPVENYSFNCSQGCGLDCGKISYPDKGAEAAIAELALCGTLNATNVTYMVNHTIREWMSKIDERGRDKNFYINMSIREIKVLPIDAWNFSITVDSEIEIVDRLGICYYMEDRSTTRSNTSIIGLEDPLYTLGSNGRIIKYIDDCETRINITTVAGCSKSEDRGWGNTSGTVIFYSDIEAVATNYCTDNEDYVNDKILIFDKAFGGCNQIEASCFNKSEEYHFVGYIDYAPNDPNSFVKKCLDTGLIVSNIAWISDTGAMDNESNYGQETNETCYGVPVTANITDGDCIYIKNDDDSGMHQVIVGLDARRLNYSCYSVSNTSKPVYSSGCAVLYADGPSFFDRLDGRYNLSDRYVNQSLEYYNNTQIGIETIVNVFEIMDHGIEPYPDATKIDYLYWKNRTGLGLCGVCSTGLSTFKLDCQHINRYDADIC